MYDTKIESRVLVVGLITVKNRMVDIDSYFDEFKNLVKSNDIIPIAEYFTKLRDINNKTFISKGKLEEIRLLCIKYDIEEVIISEILSPNQETELEKHLGVKVYDRTHLILEIFEKQARSAEAKIQIEISFLEHKRTRVNGRGKLFSQQSGRIGNKGKGETQKELDLQHIDHLLVKLKRDIKELQQIKETQRKKRLKNNVKKITLIGYTNAGKSTLFNALTKENVFVEDKLFATLDTTTRELYLDKKKIGLLSDTIGFIQNLPTQLIESFNATLKELEYSDLLIHVIDISNKNWDQHLVTVNKILYELNLKDKKVIYAVNKIDKISPESLELVKPFLPEPYFLIEANNRDSINNLINYLIDYANIKEEIIYELK